MVLLLTTILVTTAPASGSPAGLVGGDVASLGLFCGFILETSVRAGDAEPLQCLRRHLATCTPAYVHGATMSRGGEAHEAVFVRRDENTGRCRVVVAINSQPMIEHPARRLASRTCSGLVEGNAPASLLDWASGCKEERVLSSCPTLVDARCTWSPPGVETCGALEPILHSEIAAEDAIEPPATLHLEPGWETALSAPVVP